MIRGEVLCSSLRDGRTVRFSRDFGGRPHSYRWLGTDRARDAGRRVWQIAWAGGNDLLRDLDAEIADTAAQLDLTQKINAVPSQLGTVGDRFLDACSKDLRQ